MCLQFFLRCEGSFCSVKGLCIGPVPSIMQCREENKEGASSTASVGLRGQRSGFCRQAEDDCPANHCCEYSRCLPYGCCSGDATSCLVDNYANGTTAGESNLAASKPPDDPYLGRVECPSEVSEIKMANFKDSRDRNRCVCTCDGSDPWALVTDGQGFNDCAVEPVESEVDVKYDQNGGKCSCTCQPTIKFAWADWTAFSDCSVTCGKGGVQSRDRICINNEGTESEECISETGNSQRNRETETRECDTELADCPPGKCDRMLTHHN